MNKQGVFGLMLLLICVVAVVFFGLSSVESFDGDGEVRQSNGSETAQALTAHGTTSDVPDDLAPEATEPALPDRQTTEPALPANPFDCHGLALCEAVLGADAAAVSDAEAAWMRHAGYPLPGEFQRLVSDVGYKEALAQAALQGNKQAAALLGAAALAEGDLEAAEDWLGAAKTSCTPFVYRQLGYLHLALDDPEMMDVNLGSAYLYFRMAYLSGDVESAVEAAELVNASEGVRLSMQMMDQFALRLLNSSREDFPGCRRNNYLRPR